MAHFENAFGRFAVVSANPNAQWLDPGRAVPAGDPWTRSSVMPIKGTERLLCLAQPKTSQLGAGDVAWILFIPGLGAGNGWEDHPETISGSAFVQCRVVAEEGRFTKTGTMWTWLRVAVGDVMAFTDLERRCPAQRLAHLETWELRAALIRRDGWELLWGPFDDAGFWLLARPGSQEIHIVAGGEWVLMRDVAWAGHVVVPAAEWERICALRDG